MGKPRLLIIGGKPFNVPPQISEHFEIAKHIEQDQMKFSLPSADYVMVICNWVNHSAISSVRNSMPRTPVIWVRKGWPAMRAELLRRGLIPEAEIETPEMVEEPEEPESSTPMSEEELESATRPRETPVQSEVDRMFQEFMRLTEESTRFALERAKLLEDQRNLEVKIEAVEKQLEVLKPFAENFKVLAASARNVREALEQLQRK